MIGVPRPHWGDEQMTTLEIVRVTLQHASRPYQMEDTANAPLDAGVSEYGMSGSARSLRC